LEKRLPFIDIKNENAQWLSRFEEAVNKLEALEKDAKSFIEGIQKTNGETSGDINAEKVEEN
jgi:hypothetical protein